MAQATLIGQQFDPLPICATRGTHHLAKLPFLSPSNFWLHLLKHIQFLPGFFIYLLSTLCGPVVSSTGAHGFVHIYIYIYIYIYIESRPGRTVLYYIILYYIILYYIIFGWFCGGHQGCGGSFCAGSSA